MPLAALGPILAGAAGTSAAATAAAWGAIGAGGAAAANIYGAKKAAGASENAAATSAASNAAALAEQKRQDDLQFQEFQQQQAAAKAQWDAQQQIRAPYRQAGAASLSAIGDILGVPFGGGGSSSGAPASAPNAPSGPLPTIDASQPIGPQVLSYFAQRKTTPNPTTAAYFEQKWPELVARGKELGDPLYAQKRLADADEFGRSNTGTAPISAVMPPRQLAPPMLPPMGGPANAFATPYAPVIPISQVMGAQR